MRVPRDGVRHDGELVEQLVDVFLSAVRRREHFPEGSKSTAPCVAAASRCAKIAAHRVRLSVRRFRRINFRRQCVCSRVAASRRARASPSRARSRRPHATHASSAASQSQRAFSPSLAGSPPRSTVPSASKRRDGLGEDRRVQVREDRVLRRVDQQRQVEAVAPDNALRSSAGAWARRVGRRSPPPPRPGRRTALRLNSDISGPPPLALGVPFWSMTSTVIARRQPVRKPTSSSAVPRVASPARRDDRRSPGSAAEAPHGVEPS